MFVPGKPFQTCLMFVCEARSLPRVEHMKVASLGQALALPGNVRLGLPGNIRLGLPGNIRLG